jgi:hypothetical protein
MGLVELFGCDWVGAVCFCSIPTAPIAQSNSGLVLSLYGLGSVNGLYRICGGALSS